MLLKVASKYNLSIYDRNYNLNKKEFQFPEELQSYIQGMLEPQNIQLAYKGYKIALNVNSVTDSPTMFSRRVFECLASNTPVISTYSKGIKNLFGDLVFMSPNEDELNAEFEKLLQDEEYYRKKAHLGMRSVLEKHTFEHRFLELLKRVGIIIKDALPPDVLVIGKVNSREDIQLITDMFKGQKHERKNLVFLSDKADQYHSSFPDYRFVNNLDEIKEEHSYFTLFSASNLYGPSYLSDLLLTTAYSQAHIVGKKGKYVYQSDTDKIKLIQPDQIHCYVETLDLYASLYKKKVFQRHIKHQKLAELNKMIPMDFFMEGLGFTLQIHLIL